MKHFENTSNCCVFCLNLGEYNLNMTKYILLFLLYPLSSFGQFKINEASNSNGNTILLPNGDSPDWIEIYNASSSSANISGYGLSDDPSNLMKWIFPTTSIGALNFLTVFANGNNAINLVNHYETAVFAESTWKYKIPTAEIPNWKNNSFNSSSWLNGTASIGFGDGDDATVLTAPITTIYSRITFQCTNITAISEALLDIDYDDGFVAYINGVEIARAGLMGTPPLWNEFSTDHEATLPQGGAISSFDIDINLLQSALVIGANVLAIELHNVNANSSDLTCKPYLSFGFNQSNIFYNNTVHPYFATSFGTNLEANFSISTVGETLYLSNPAGVLIDSLLVLDLEPNMSCGKFPNGSNNISIFSIPTPNASNNSALAYNGYEKQPTILNIGGIFQGPISVSVINNSVSNGILRYTTNGSNPKVNSALVTGPISINTNTVLKVTCFSSVGANLLPSIIAGETFLFAEDFELPIVSLTIDSADLYGANGIFDNWWTDWKKPCIVEYFDKDGIKKFETRSSVKPDGGAGGSRSNPQHSVTIEPANTVFGEGKPVHYPIIPQKPFITDYYALYIRNGSNFWNQYPQRDATFNRIMNKTNVNSQAYTPAVVFLNGAYFGVYELREKANEGYFENNYGNDRDSIDLLSVSYFYGAGVIRTVKGSNTSFYSMRDYIANTNPYLPNYFDECHKRLDLFNFTDYMAGENWFGNADWIYNNMKMARTRTFDNKWRFFLQDLEWGLGGWTNYTSNMFDWFENQSQGTPFWDIYNGLIQNPKFKNYFINRYADLMNTTFQADHYQGIIDSMYSELLVDYPRSLLLWTGNSNMGNYTNIHNTHLDQFANRNDFVRDQIVSEYNLVNKVDVTLDVFPVGAGYIKISTIVPENLPWTGVYFNGNPVKITAIANPGYTFQHWGENLTLSLFNYTEESITINIQNNDLFRAHFSGSPKQEKITISEINYNPDPTVDGGNWIELHNFGTAPIDLTAWSIKSKNYWDKFTFEDQTILNPGAYLVVCENTNLFSQMYPQVSNFVGGTGFVWSNKWDSVKLYNPFENIRVSAVYTDESPYPKCADGWGRTLENKNISLLPLDSLTWFCGCIGGSPGEAYSPCEEPIIISEFNYNNSNSSNNAGDWIELYNNTSSTINLNSYIFKDAKNDNEYIFPSVSIPPDSFIVISNDLLLFSQQHPLVSNFTGQFNFGLSSDDGIRIYDNTGTLINSFTYDTLAPWSAIPSALNFTNEYNFYNGYLDQNSGLSWFVGCPGGSPGTQFISCTASVDQDDDNSDRFVRLFPNPACSLITLTIENALTFDEKTEFIIYNLNGSILEKRSVNTQETFTNIEVNLQDFKQGMYYVRVKQKDRSLTLPFVKI